MSLYPYQREGAAFLRSRRRALLADQMGLGKTVQALMAIPEQKNAAALVVCPASLLGNWMKEAHRWRPDKSVMLYRRGDGQGIWPVANTLMVASYTQLPSPEEAIQQAPPAPTALILDEAHYAKNSQAVRTRSVRALARRAAAIWMLTGTPVPNRPSELWALAQSCGWIAEELFGSWDDFLRLFHATPKKFGGYDWGQPDASVPGRLKPWMLRRMRHEVLVDLPSKTYRTLDVDVGKLSREHAEEWMQRLAALTDDELLAECGKPGAFSTLRAKLADLKQGDAEGMVHEYEEQAEPLVVFSAHRGPIQSLAHAFDAEPIMGDTPPAKRTALVEAFQAGRLGQLFGTIGAMGVGLTLTKAAHALFIDRAWTPADNAQAEDRLCRIGQTRGVLVTDLVSEHPVERRVYEVLRKKREMLDELGMQT